MTLDELNKKLEEVAEDMAKLAVDAPFAVVKNVEGIYLKRIFNRGLDTNGSSIGEYKKASYKKKRDAEGRQTDYVDLQFKGDLFNSIQSGTQDEKAVIFFNNQNELKIANHLTTKYKKDIFQVSESEKETAKQFMLDYIRSGMEEIIKKLK